MASAWLPPQEPWSPTIEGSFARTSVAKRWPSILTSAIDALYQASFALSYSSDRQMAEAKINESKEIVEKLSKLKHDMGRDKPLELIGDDGGDSTEEYDAVVKENGWTWFTAPWLFCECYLYRLVRSIFARSSHWQQYDPFSTQKIAAFRSSASAVASLSDAVEPLIRKAEMGAQQRLGVTTKDDKQDVKAINDGLFVLFREIAQTSLWGNATDLSLLTHLKHEDLQELQAGGLGAEAQAKRERFILSGLDGLRSAWDAILQQQTNAKDGGQSHVDIILDNSGFELFTDLILADFLVSSGMTEQVIFHPKDMPWFVSDVTPHDFFFTLEALQSADFFNKSHHSGQGSQADVPIPPRTSRSSSRQRAMVADLYHFEGERRDMSPAGSRILRMESVREEGGTTDKEAYGSRTLQRRDTDQDASATVGRAEEAENATLGERGRPGRQTVGSRSLQLDPSFFQNARSRTVSPSRSSVMDAANMHSFGSALDGSGDRRDVSHSSIDEEEHRGRSTVNENTTAAQRLSTRWANYIAAGKFALSMPANTPLGGSKSIHQSSQGDFWTSYHNYPSMSKVAPHLHGALAQSLLVISKGDLNFRKWTSDAQWPFHTPFADTLGPAKGTMNLLVLRTNKADVCVGVPKDRLATLDAEDPEWRTNGKYALVEFVAKT